MIKITRLPKTICDHTWLCFKCGTFEFLIGVMICLMGAFMYAATVWW